MYPIKHFVGLDKETLIVHMCHPFIGTADMVEFHTVGGQVAVLSREQFNEMVAWVNTNFDQLSKQVVRVH